MCTVSWIHTAEGYELFCNRDERRARKVALLPQVLNIRGVRAISPRDGDFGGTWISVNEFGLAMSLLNLYGRPTHSDTDLKSRGLLLMELVDCRSGEEVIERMEGMLLRQYQPFTLLALMPDQRTVIHQWDGTTVLTDFAGIGRMPLTSSSFDSGRVIEGRKAYFKRLTEATGVESDAVLAFHRSHHPSPGPYSTCMHRADAETVSFSRIIVDSNSIEFRYYPHSPCREGQGEIKILPRANP